MSAQTITNSSIASQAVIGGSRASQAVVIGSQDACIVPGGSTGGISYGSLSDSGYDLSDNDYGRLLADASGGGSWYVKTSQAVKE